MDRPERDRRQWRQGTQAPEPAGERARPDEPVLVAGEPERQEARARRAGGIPVDETTWGELLEAAESVGLAKEEACRTARVAP
ncbi:MAG: hypothetical protein Kow0092_23630 [Deferrisomatales bacterium]